MATTVPKKAVLQTAATDSYSKPGAAMDQAKPLIGKLNDAEGKPTKAVRKADKGREPR